MERYQRYIGFVEINRKHLGENLASIVEIILKKYSIRQKLLTITTNNASNNDTLYQHLHQALLRQFNDHLEPFPIRNSTMQFYSEDS
jgi:hypothetical protein